MSAVGSPRRRRDIALEPRTVADADALFPLLADPEMFRYLDIDPPASVDALREHLARSESRRSPDGSEHWLNWIVRDEAGTIVGYVQATIAPSGETNVAYAIGRAHWGQGLGRAAVARMIESLAADFGVRALFIVAERANTGSLRLADALGFTEAPDAVRARKNATASEVVLQKVLDPGG